MAVDEAERAEVLQGPVGGAAPGASARTAPGSSKRGRQSAGLGPAVCRWISCWRRRHHGARI